MRLAALSPRFIRHKVEKAEKYHGRLAADGLIQWGGFDTDCLHDLKTLADAQGIWFDCPKCTVANNGPTGTHGVLVWFEGRGAPERLGRNKDGQTVRWVVSGTNMDDLKLSPSIALQGGCNWHGFIGKDIPGEVTEA